MSRATDAPATSAMALSHDLLDDKLSIEQAEFSVVQDAKRLVVTRRDLRAFGKRVRTLTAAQTMEITIAAWVSSFVLLMIAGALFYAQRSLVGLIPPIILPTLAFLAMAARRTRAVCRLNARWLRHPRGADIAVDDIEAFRVRAQRSDKNHPDKLTLLWSVDALLVHGKDILIMDGFAAQSDAEQLAKHLSRRTHAVVAPTLTE